MTEGDGTAPEQLAPSRPGWARAVGGVGRVLVTLGVLVLLFVAYQLWGTGLREARAQDALRSQFDAQLAAAGTTTSRPTTTVPPTTVPGTTIATTTTEPTTTIAPNATVPLTKGLREGDALARIVIPKIGVDRIVVAGVARRDLQKGPGHYPETPLPGQKGNAAIAGHRTTYGAPFNRIDELAKGDEIWVTTVKGTYRYVLSRDPFVVAPTDLSVVRNTKGAVLTLTACHPKYSARQRIVVRADLDSTASAIPDAPTPNAYAVTPTTADDSGDGDQEVGADDTTTTIAAATSTSAAVAATTSVAAPTTTAAAADLPERRASVDELADGWFSDSSAFGPALGWGALVAALALAAWALARLLPQPLLRLTVYVAFAPFVLLALFFWFGEVSRLLPANL